MNSPAPASPRHPGRLSNPRTQGWLKGLFLVIPVIIAYLPAMQGGFVWDDDSWTTSITKLLHSPSGLCSMWLNPTALQQYYPLSGTTFWLDYQLWKFWTLPYHVENVLLHILAALLLWRVLLRLDVPGAWLASALFALHPVMVESVAWITERKNVLSLIFYLGAFLAYAQYAPWITTTSKNSSTPETSRSRWHRPFFYGLALILFLCALLAKTTTFSLPAAILLIGWWKRGQIRWREDAFPTLPFFALALGLCTLTAWLERHHVGAEGSDFTLSFPQRCIVAGRVFWFYIGKLFWPVNLCFVYPRWKPNPALIGQWLYPLTALGGMVGLWLGQKRIGRGPIAALLFYVGALFPLLGFLNAYGMLYSFVWDHWVYLPALGIIVLAAAFVTRAAQLLHAEAVVYGFAAIVLPALAVLTWRQAGTFINMETLWRTTIARNPDAAMVYNNLGLVQMDRGQTDAALANFRKAAQIQPDDASALNNIGAALSRKGQVNEAIPYLQKAIALQPNFARPYCNLGSIFLAKGQVDTAILYYEEAIKLRPEFDLAHNGLGSAFVKQGQMDEAIDQFRIVLQLQPDSAEALDNLGMALLQKGEVSQAIVSLEEELQGHPDDAVAHNYLGFAFLQQGQAGPAKANFQKVLKLQPDSLDARKYLAWILATCPDASIRNGIQAVELAQEANQLSRGTNPAILATLAAAQAENGHFADALGTAQKALVLATAQTNTAAVNAVKKQIGNYEKGAFFRDDSLTNTQPATP